MTDNSRHDGTSRMKHALASLLSDPPQRQPAKMSDNHDRKRGEKDRCEISPRTIVEGLLFVGINGTEGISAQQIAAVMRDVSPSEVEETIEELNRDYETWGSPYRIGTSSRGFVLRLTPDYQKVALRLRQKTQPAKLSPAATEVLSLVAYNQPISRKEIETARGKDAAGLIRSLLRRGLICQDRRKTNEPLTYTTTERFLKLVQIESLDQLPKHDDFAAA